MCYVPTIEEFNALVVANIDKRVKYFKNRVGGHCYFWCCIDEDGNLLLNYDSNGNECLLVWPAKKFAESVVSSDDVVFLQQMNIYDFLNDYLDELRVSNISIMVFPTINGGGALFNVDNFAEMIIDELSQYGDFDLENNLEQRFGINKR